MEIRVGARGSPLSKIQTKEVLSELQRFHPYVRFSPSWITTTGDKDLSTPLWKAQIDFFTKEIDEKQLRGNFRISIHSAKDLPSSIPEGLEIVAITKGVSSYDSLVMAQEMSVQTLPKNARIGTSSKRREAAIKALRSDLQTIDIRGSIQERLLLLENSSIDGLVIAEAALIRLKLTCLNRIFLEHEPEPLQGKLAIIARKEDNEMRTLFSCIDAR